MQQGRRLPGDISEREQREQQAQRKAFRFAGRRKGTPVWVRVTVRTERFLSVHKVIE